MVWGLFVCVGRASAVFRGARVDGCTIHSLDAVMEVARPRAVGVYRGIRGLCVFKLYLLASMKQEYCLGR